MEKYRYFCPSCREHFHRDKANMNERHYCGAFADFDWDYEGEENSIEDGFQKTDV